MPELMNLAQIVYNAYPGSDLLPIDPNEHLASLDMLRKYVTSSEYSGDTLFRFIVNELWETIDPVRPSLRDGLRALERAQSDLRAVINAVDNAS